MASDRTVNSELYSVEPNIRRMTLSQSPEFLNIKWADIKEVTFDSPDGKKIYVCGAGSDFTID